MWYYLLIDSGNSPTLKTECLQPMTQKRFDYREQCGDFKLKSAGCKKDLSYHLKSKPDTVEKLRSALFNLRFYSDDAPIQAPRHGCFFNACFLPPHNNKNHIQ